MILKTIPAGQLQANCYILSTNDKDATVIDPGGDAALIYQELRAANLNTISIICTHCHLDHIAGIPDLLRILQKNASTPEIYIHSNGKELLGKASGKLHEEGFKIFGPQGKMLFESMYSELPDADILFQHNFEVPKTGLKVLHTPGHSADSVTFISLDYQYAFTGDTLFAGSIGRTDLPGGDYSTLMASIRDKLLPLPEECIIYPGHGHASTIGEEKRSNPFLRELA